MKIVKSQKREIGVHFYVDREMESKIRCVWDCLNGETLKPIRILTNMFKGSAGDEWADLYITVSGQENRLYIDNEKKEMTLNIMYDDVESFLECLELFLADKRVGKKEMLRLFISKKEYSLMGYNQQHKKYERIAQKREQERKMLDEQRERCA